jgi:hypothetical protein
MDVTRFTTVAAAIWQATTDTTAKLAFSIRQTNLLGFQQKADEN